MNAPSPIRFAAVIPVFNGARFLRVAIDSILAQTSPVDELIVVDDGSTDNTREVALSYGSRVKYVYQENRGLPGARNAGIAASTAEWVAFLDCDDRWLPDKIERQRELLRQNPDAILAYGDEWERGSDGSTSQVHVRPPEELWPRLRTRNCFSSNVIVVKREALQKVGGYNERLRACEDWDLYVRLYPHGRFVYLPEPLAVYHVMPGQMSSDPERMLANFEAILEPTLLHGLRGVSRWMFRRKARASQLFSAALIAREGGDLRRFLRYRRQSLWQWPSPAWEPRRYASFASGWLRGLRSSKRSSADDSAAVVPAAKAASTEGN